jgi:transposase
MINGTDRPTCPHCAGHLSIIEDGVVETPCIPTVNGFVPKGAPPVRREFVRTFAACDGCDFAVVLR